MLSHIEFHGPFFACHHSEGETARSLWETAVFTMGGEVTAVYYGGRGLWGGPKW